MDAVSLDILDILDESIDNRWNRVDNELRLPDYSDPNVSGMMLAHVSINDGTVTVTEFEGWGISGQFVFSGSPSVIGPRVASLLDTIAGERA